MSTMRSDTEEGTTSEAYQDEPDLKQESLTIDGHHVPHYILPIRGDGNCLFRAISFILYGSQLLHKTVRQSIVRQVVGNWRELEVLTSNERGDNYSCLHAYTTEMMTDGTFGGLCELSAAGDLFRIHFEVYSGGKCLAKVGEPKNRVRRLRFSGNLSFGHFEVLLPKRYSQCASLIMKNGAEKFNFCVFSGATRYPENGHQPRSEVIRGRGFRLRIEPHYLGPTIQICCKDHLSIVKPELPSPHEVRQRLAKNLIANNRPGQRTPQIMQRNAIIAEIIQRNSHIFRHALPQFLSRFNFRSARPG
ncbi:uncharacterized protein LOC121405017 [Drosophila obscura]|uniref:uncharacterized protein LOC121405017 n=1 Tax=Drosophila obscura TaxID=7282 RepID=UPI001BB16ECE|nr:uncharacterized protein LOC121405017 [Drosophila obscura]